jgi:hypothetical protein
MFTDLSCLLSTSERSANDVIERISRIQAQSCLPSPGICMVARITYGALRFKKVIPNEVVDV